MSRQILTKGTLADDGTGEALRDGGLKLDANFAETYITILSVVTTAGTITLSFLVAAIVSGGGTFSAIRRIFLGATSFAGPKTIALAASTESKIFDFYFQITNVAAVLTLPDSFILSDPLRWDPTTPGSKTWSPLKIGKYKMHAVFDGTSWWCDISTDTYV